MASSPIDDPIPETDIPPTVWCAHCGQSHCEGCAPPVSSSRQDPASRGEHPGFLWERADTSGSAYWLRFSRSALQTIQPERFAWGGASPVLRMLQFAIVAESLAILSFALPVLAVLAALFPSLAWAVAHSAEMAGLGLALLFVAVVGVLALHVLWGLALELGAWLSGAKLDLGRGQRFALYACGWDVLSSPAGFLLVAGLLDVGAARGALNAGFKAPREALRAYLGSRGIDAEKQGKAVAVSFVITGGIFLGALIGVPAYWIAQALW